MCMRECKKAVADCEGVGYNPDRRLYAPKVWVLRMEWCKYVDLCYYWD